MPYGKTRGGHKGRSRKFTNIEELKSQEKDEQKWRSRKQESDSEDGSSSSEEEDNKAEPVIPVNNPNHVVNKTKKLSQLGSVSSMQAKPELSRREREEVQRQEATRRYQQLHAQGKTDEARADLARLAIIRKEREAAAERRRLEKEEAENRQKAAKEASLNAIKSGGRSAGRGRKKK